MADVDLTQSDTLTFTETPGGVATSVSTDRTAADRFRLTEAQQVAVSGVDPLLARPLYALIETPPLSATIIDYLEIVPDDEWRESGIDIDI